MTNIRLFLVTIPAVLFQIIRSKLKEDWSTVVTELLVALGILLAAASGFGGGYYQGMWLAMGMTMALGIALVVSRVYGLAPACLLGYLIASTLYIVTCVQSRYAHLDPYEHLAINLFSAESCLKLLLLTIPFLAMRRGNFAIREAGRALIVVAFFVSLIEVFWQRHTTGCDGINTCGGALMNPSLNDSMLAVCLPIVAALSPLGWASVILVAMASMVGKSAIGMGMCALYVGLLLWERGGRFRLPGILLAPPVFLTAGYLTHGTKAFFDSAGRFNMWAFFMKLWAHNWHNWFFGMGFGTFGIFSQNLQQHFGQSASQWWLWMHNDWLQMLFEGGAVGLLLMAWVYFDVLKRLRAKGYRQEFQSLLLFGVMMGCNFPLHIAPCCLFAAWLTYVAYEKPA